MPKPKFMKNAQAHHGLPIKHEDWFNKRGIKDIHDPKYGWWVEAEKHQSFRVEYDKEWVQFRNDFPNAEVWRIEGFFNDLSNNPRYR